MRILNSRYFFQEITLGSLSLPSCRMVHPYFPLFRLDQSPLLNNLTLFCHYSSIDFCHLKTVAHNTTYPCYNQKVCHLAN